MNEPAGALDAPSPVRPRHAASLVIYRVGRGGPEVVMGRRSARARFKPGVYVFPGGMLERADHRVRPASGLPGDIVSRIAVAGSQQRANALALAAIRETFEESGLVVGVPGDPGPTTDPSWQALRARGIAPELAPLRYLGRAITPSVQPIRFHARFFAIEAEHVSGELAGTGELADLQWVPLGAARSLPVMDVTLLMLESLRRQLEDGDRRAAFLSFQHGRRQILWG